MCNILPELALYICKPMSKRLYRLSNYSLNAYIYDSQDDTYCSECFGCPGCNRSRSCNYFAYLRQILNNYMKKQTWGALALTLAGVGFLSGCAFTALSESQKSPAPIASESAAPSQSIDYTNAQYGFRFTFSSTWKGYTVTQRNLDWGVFGKSESLDFGFGEKNPIFNIAIHTKEQWKKIAAEQEADSRYAQVALGESKDFVFSFASTGDVANDEMGARLAEVQEIIKTFDVK